MTVETPTAAPTAEPIALTATMVAQMLSVSVATIWRLHSSGRLPRPLTIGARNTRWVKSEIIGWIAAAAPPRVVWETLRGAANANGRG